MTTRPAPKRRADGSRSPQRRSPAPANSNAATRRSDDSAPAANSNAATRRSDDSASAANSNAATRRSKRAAGRRVAAQPAKHPAPAGRRRSATPVNSSKRRFPALPTPLVMGAVALLVAGGGAIVVSSNSEPAPLTNQYQALSSSLSGTDGDPARTNDPNNIDVSRDFDRDLLEKQAEQQAEQRDQALQQLVAKTQKRAKELKTNQWVLPVAGYRLTARFGQASSLWSTVHTGLDFAAPSGATISSVARGTVKEVGYAGAYGNRTIVTLDDGTEIWYCHQSATRVTPGETVDPGQAIGAVGSTGNVTGPHLHLEVRPGGGDPIDPNTALIEHGVQP